LYCAGRREVEARATFVDGFWRKKKGGGKGGGGRKRETGDLLFLAEKCDEGQGGE